MKKILLSILFVLISINPAIAKENWVNTKNTTKPVVFLDTNSVYRLNSGAVYTIRYFNKDNEDVIATIYTDLNTKAGVIAVYPYFSKIKYKYKMIPDSKLKVIDSESSIYNSLNEVKRLIRTENIKYCPPKKYDRY